MLRQVEVENFVLKMAAEFPSRRDQLIFLINNYDMMLSVLMVRTTSMAADAPCFSLGTTNMAAAAPALV